MATLEYDNETEMGTVYVLGIPFAVFLVDDLVMSDDTKLGVLQPGTHSIFIDRSVDIWTRKSVLIHEILHAIDVEIGCRLEEEDILRLETGITSFFFDKRNIKILEALSE